jgi:hypothetical protein
LYSNSTGSNNVAVGNLALGTSNSSDNTAIGYQAGASVSSGTGNVLMGYRAGNTIAVGANNTILGNDADCTDGYANTVLGAFSTGGGGSTVIGYNSNDTFSGSVVIGNGAASTAANQFVVGSAGNNAGSVVAGVNTSTQYWNVIINGTAYKILLA